MCSHGHGGNGGGGGGGACADHAAAFEHYEHGMQYNMDKFINKAKVVVLNEAVEGTGVTVFKTWDERLDKSKCVESDVDEELLFCIPFTANVKLTGITFAGPMDSSFPARVRIYKDRENMSFGDCSSAKPDQEMELKQDDRAAIDYPLASHKFGSVGHLTLYFPGNFGDEKTLIYYIGLRGEFQSEFRNKIVIATYEARPVPDDHKAGLRDPVNHQIC